MGGRSRVAAQMLARKGFDNVYNLSGGMKSWQAEVAFYEQERGLALFTGNESPENVLKVAYSLEEGLHDFYLSMTTKVKSNKVRNLFKKLAEIEIKHQDRIFRVYTQIISTPISRQAFNRSVTVTAMEGGMTTKEYADAFNIDWESAEDIVGLAMSIEAQALDLYQRAADHINSAASKSVLIQIAEEERSHLTQLGKLMARI